MQPEAPQGTSTGSERDVAGATGEAGVTPTPAAPRVRVDTNAMPLAAAETPPSAAEITVSRRPNASLWWLLAAALLIFWLARPILGPFVIAAVLAYAFSPLVASAERRTGLSRLVIVLIGYVVTLVALGILAWLLTGRLVAELQLLSASGPDSLAALLRGLLGSDTIVLGSATMSVQQISSEIESAISGLVSTPGGAIEVAKQVGDLALNVVLVIIVTFYLLVDGQRFLNRTVTVLPAEHRERTTALLGRIHEVLGRWLRGQLLLVALVSIVVYVILGPILHLRYALAIGILTGVLEVIPLIGPVVAAVIAATDAFAQSGSQTAILVIVIYVVLRQVEDQLVMPVVIGRAVHLHPVVTIFAVLVGLSTYGILGGLLGVPAAAAVNVLFRELYPPEPEAAST
jgi:predicted PurR-regulated permease PerM